MGGSSWVGESTLVLVAADLSHEVTNVTAHVLCDRKPRGILTAQLPIAAHTL